MKRINNIQVSLDQGLAIEQNLAVDLESRELANILGVAKAYLAKRSIDARKKNNVHFVLSADIPEHDDTQDERAQNWLISLRNRPKPKIQETLTSENRPVVIGAGPAGLFAALELAEAGYCPLVIERGSSVDERKKDIETFYKNRVLNPSSNVQFGEGGAGTFSDGKLTCGRKSLYTQKILQSFVAAGAPSEILWQAKPHIGTDILCDVVKEIRQHIIACGGEVLFNTQVVDFKSCSSKTNKANCTKEIDALLLKDNDDFRWMPAKHVILALGHSARDTFSALLQAGFKLEQKPFSIGLRIEHKQEKINFAQYGKSATHPALKAADYKLSTHLKNGRGVYTFCMCPGGEVIAASSEANHLCINGMSKHARNGQNANAALLCSVTPRDFNNSNDPLAGIAFQRTWEHKAFELGGSNWRAPVMSVGAFLGQNKVQSEVTPSYSLGVYEADLRDCLPSYVAHSLHEALPLLDKQLKGFAAPEAMLTGIEARSSSPVRIVRNATSLEATRWANIYPCGEGAGYAGGIMSAAIDGIRCAQALMEKLTMNS